MKRYRSLKRLTQPVVEPVSLMDAKAHCRVDSNDDDAYIASLVSAAREWVEDYLDRTLVHTQLQMRLDQFPAEIELPRPPMASGEGVEAVSVEYTTNDTGTLATLAEDRYRVDREATPGVIRTLYGQTWPANRDDAGSVTVTWWAGYGPDGTRVPRRICHAMLMLVSTWYERRTAVDNLGASEVPFGVKSLLDSVSWGGYA